MKSTGAHVAHAARSTRRARAAAKTAVLALPVALAMCAALAVDARASASASAPEPLDSAALFQSASEALAEERPGEAIANLEALADRGLVDAVSSYHRGLAYAARVRAGGEQPGDLGRAAHAFEEARELTRDPSLRGDATRALSIVRAEVARRRARAGDPVEIGHGASLGRSIVKLLPEDAWASIAALLSLALVVGIVVRSRAGASRAKVAATTSAAISAALLVVTSTLAWAARDARLHQRDGVIVTPSARMLDDRRLATDGPALPEGARARLLEERDGYSRIELFGKRGTVPSSAVLPIAKR